MNPNKKILNPKNNSPWLLCPSKSFPGKFYYFNGSTGETAWCLSETDQNLKKGTIHRVTDKTHTYPEPFDPPIDDSTNNTNSFTSLKNAGNTEFNHATETRPSPVFGQAVFPKYVSPDIFTPKFVWALTPMYVPSQLPHRQMLEQMPHRQMLEQMPQTYDQPIFVNSVPNFQPLKTKFTPNGFQFQNQPYQYKERPMFDQTTNTTFQLAKRAQTLVKPPMKDEACQTFVPIRAKRLRTQSESDSTPKSALKASRSVGNLTILFDNVETSTLSRPSKVDNETGKLSELDKNDLRFKLVAKKRKVNTVESRKTEKSADQSTSKPRETLTPKKRVTFDVQESGPSSISSEDMQEIDQSPGSSRMEELSQPTPDGPWYVVADTAALLADWQCIEEIVKSDARGRLLVPHAVCAELEARGRGDAGALSARQLLRKLAVQAGHIVVQSKPEYELSPEDSVLQCCWTLIQEDCHVILISNNTNTLNKAKSINLECYTLGEIKDDSQTSTEPQNEPKNLKSFVETDKNKSENLFMQDLSQVNGLCLPKPNGFKLSESRMNILDTEPDTGGEFSKRDANSDKLINLTRLKKTNTVFHSEITNVRDQITKLSITENISVNNRSKQIMNNVFRTVLDNKVDQDTPIDMKNHDCNQNLSDKNKLVFTNQNVPKRIEIIDEIDRDIRRLNVTENIENSRDTITVSGITKLNNQFNLDKELERFYVKNAIVENRIKSRLDEWVCRLNQTMEGLLTEILLKEKPKMKKMMPPWNLFEAIQVTGETFKKQQYVKAIIDRFSMKLLSCSSSNGKLNKDVKPNDFMKLVGLSIILIEHLKEIVNCKELYEADDMLVDLIKHIDDPKTDIDLSLENVNTPVLSKSEMLDEKAPAGFKKKRTEIVEYLKKHFAAWQHETDNPTENVNDETNKEPNIVQNCGKHLDTNDNTINKKPNIVRTCGKDLKTLKINNTKAITVENKEADKADVKDQPKVIRNVKIIAAYEERLKKEAQLDVDQLDYESETIYTVSDEDDKLNDKKEETNLPDDFVLNDLSVSASSVNTEATRAYPLAKIFLVKLKSTLVKIFEFINTSIREYKEGMSIEKKAGMMLKTELTRQYVLKINERLKNIIARESSDTKTLKHLLVKAGDYVEGDVVMTNYKQTVTKYLEQTQILEEVLEHMLSLSKAVSAKEKEEPCSDSHNSRSPILPTRRKGRRVLPTNGS